MYCEKFIMTNHLFITSIFIILICIYYNFIVTFTGSQQACNSCVLKLHNTCYRGEMLVVQKTCSTSSCGTNLPGHANSVNDSYY